MYEYLGKNLNSYNLVNRAAIESLELQCSPINFYNDESISLYADNLNEAIFQNQLQKTAQKFGLWLLHVSLPAKTKTQKLLSKQVKRHLIKPLLIEKSKISEKPLDVCLDVYLDIYNYPALTLEESRSPKLSYTKFVPNRLAKAITALTALRQKYTLMSMHDYNSQILLQLLSHTEQILICGYFKVINNHYLLLQRAYTTAAINCHSVALMALQLELMLTLVSKVCLEPIQMLHLLAQEISKRLNTEQANTLIPCF